jgi:ribosomal protein L11 methyltransferase
VSEARYPFVAVDVVVDRSEEIGSRLFELGATGVEERDDQTLVRGAGGGRVTLVGSFSTREEADHAIAELASEGLEARLEEVVGDAWRDAWKEHFAPFALTPRITVRPPWVPYERKHASEMVLELEPGRAFGTGLHATTSLVAEALDARAASLAGAEVLDVGCGSGILALAALLLGAKSALAIDVDPDVIEIVRENAGRNDLSERVTAACRPIEDITHTYPFVLANIEARVLGPMAPELARVLAPGGTLILSGVLAAEHDAMVTRFTTLPRALTHVETTRRGDGGDAWVAIAFAARP